MPEANKFKVIYTVGTTSQEKSVMIKSESSDLVYSLAKTMLGEQTIIKKILNLA